MRKIVAAIAICVSLFIISSFSVALAATYQHGDYTIVVENGTAEIHKYYGSESYPDIPEHLKGNPVTKIGSFAFKDNCAINYITIPYFVKTIENSAFKGCSNLRLVNLGDQVQTIEYSAFEDCISLEIVNFTPSIRTIQTNAFSGCISLKEVRLPTQLTTIPLGCFSDCVSLSEITIPDGVKLIEKFAFGSCISLTKVIIPPSVISIEAGAFSQCSEELTIYGMSGSYAEKHAAEYRIPFVALDVATPTPIPDSCKHSTTEWNVTTSADCINEGKRELLCSNCGEILDTEAIPAKGHVEGNPIVVVTPTETTNGVQVIQCANCKEILRSETIPAIGAPRIPGDADSDGEVNILDALAILQYDVGWAVSINVSNSDVDGSGMVDIMDALLILQYDVGWDITLK